MPLQPRANFWHDGQIREEEDFLMVLRIPLLSASFLYATIALTASAYAADSVFEEKCGSAPFAPDVPTDPSTSTEKLAEVKADVVAFMKASDVFQDCITKTIEIGPKIPKGTTPEQIRTLQDRFGRDAYKIVDQNQTDKERVGDAFNTLVDMRKNAGSTPKAEPAPKPAASLQPVTSPVATSTASVVTTNVTAARPTAIAYAFATSRTSR